MSTSSFEENEQKSWFSYLEVKYHEITEKKKNMEYLTFSNFKKKLSAVLVKFTSRVLDHFQHTTDRQKFISTMYVTLLHRITLDTFVASQINFSKIIINGLKKLAGGQKTFWSVKNPRHVRTAHQRWRPCYYD